LIAALSIDPNASLSPTPTATSTATPNDAGIEIPISPPPSLLPKSHRRRSPFATRSARARTDGASGRRVFVSARARPQTRTRPWALAGATALLGWTQADVVPSSVGRMSGDNSYFSDYSDSPRRLRLNEATTAKQADYAPAP
jgi:hypothetical protein